MNRDYSPPPPANHGRECMERLALSVVGALQRAGMTDAVAEINTRVFGRSPNDLIERFDADNGANRWRYRPMVELLLIGLAAIASNTSIDAAERKRRMQWTLEIAGF